MATWQVQQARSRFGELLDKAEREGPQTITRHGTEAAVVLSVEDYRRLGGDRPEKKKDFIQHLLDFPKFDDFEIERDKSLPREIDFGWDDADEDASEDKA